MTETQAHMGNLSESRNVQVQGFPKAPGELECQETHLWHPLTLSPRTASQVTKKLPRCLWLLQNEEIGVT